MAKIKNNPIMKGASGMLGDVVVYREYRGNVIMSNRPKRNDVLTPQQAAVKSRFLRAVQYAKRQIADPISKAEYQPSSSSRFTSAYAAALADFLSVPKVELIDATMYGGAVGDSIFIKAVDAFKITVVNVAIFGAGGQLIEQGDAVQDTDAVEDYVYKATIANALVSGSKIMVTVRDRPGNITVEEKVL